jgi:hypothetical protein
MKSKFLLAPMLLGACAGTSQYAPMSTESYFHSWYHGYYLHSVWGLGEIEASSSEAYVVCGDEQVAVRPVFDTHMWAGYAPNAGQTKEEATEHNLALLARFARLGIECILPPPDNSPPN